MRDLQATETQRSLQGESAVDLAAGVLWVHPEYGQLTRPGRRAIIGRSELCDTRLQGAKVSREHAELTHSGPALRVRDLGSRNGVWVNGQRVELAALTEGDVIRVGEWVGCVTPCFTEPVSFSELVPGLCSGPRLGRLLEPARKLASNGIPVVIQGATGSGKECVARALHAWSGRSGPYVAVNCAAIPSELAESQLFGHQKGAFTGAERAHLGLFREADGGSLLLDEFLELSARTQAKLLRVLEEREVHPLGDNRSFPVDVLLLATTQVPLADLVQAGRLRSDLAARLGVCTLNLPALASRREDIAPLFDHFVRVQAGRKLGVDSELMEWLCLQPWERNVRELEWLARSMVTLHGDASRLGLAHLPSSLRSGPSAASATREELCPRGERRPRSEDAVLCDQLRHVLADNGGVVRRAAKALGITRQRAYRLLEKEGVVLDELRKGKAEDGCDPCTAGAENTP